MNFLDRIVNLVKKVDFLSLSQPSVHSMHTKWLEFRLTDQPLLVPVLMSKRRCACQL